MALEQNKIQYLDTWDDVKEYSKKKHDAAEKEKDQHNVTKSFVNEQISSAEKKDNEEEQAVWDTYAETLYTTAQGEWSKFALGQKDFAEWDSFLQLLKDSYHYDEVKAIHDSALERVLAE